MCCKNNGLSLEVIPIASSSFTLTHNSIIVGAFGGTGDSVVPTQMKGSPLLQGGSMPLIHQGIVAKEFNKLNFISYTSRLNGNDTIEMGGFNNTPASNMYPIETAKLIDINNWLKPGVYSAADFLTSPATSQFFVVLQCNKKQNARGFDND